MTLSSDIWQNMSKTIFPKPWKSCSKRTNPSKRQVNVEKRVLTSFSNKSEHVLTKERKKKMPTILLIAFILKEEKQNRLSFKKTEKVAENFNSYSIIPKKTEKTEEKNPVKNK